MLEKKIYEYENKKYEIRLGTVSEILNLRHRILRKGFPIEEVMFDEDKLISTRNYAIFDENDNVISCLTLMKAMWNNELVWRLRAMAVDESYQNMGFGSKLLEYALDDLDDMEIQDDIWLHARTTSQDFYKRFGFEVASDIFNFGNAGPSVKMIKRSQPLYKVETAKLVDLEKCYNLEKYYELSSDSDESKGFFLPGTSLETYKTIFETGYIKTIKVNNELVAFVMVVPPGHKIIDGLFNNGSMILFDEKELDFDNIYWIAKVAVSPDFVSKGCASKLYSHVEFDFINNQCFTATAISPLRNYASEKLHNNFGMKKCGVFISKKENETYTSIVWKK